MTIAFPAVILFGLATALLVRTRQVRSLEVLVVGLFGFFLATTSLGHAVAASLNDLFTLHHGGGAPVPSPVVPTPAKGLPL